jgi:broad specificity phosphatase PhoE
VESSLEFIIHKHAGHSDSVALVVHGDYLDQSINYLMGVKRRKGSYQSPWAANWVCHNSSVSRIDINHDARNVIYLNRIDHLPAEYITW